MAATWRDTDSPARFSEPEPRRAACSAMVKEKLVMYGGWLPSYRGLRQPPPMDYVEIFNVNLSQWKQRRTTGTLPPLLRGSACTCIGHMLYMFGGWTGHRPTNSLYELHVTTLCWRELRPVNPNEGPMPKCHCGIINTSASTLCVIGGYGIPTGSLQPGSKFVQDMQSNDGRGQSNEIHSFDIPSERWRVPPTTGQGPPPSTGFTFTRVDLVTAVYFGGFNSEIMWRVADVFLLNFETWHWTALLPTGPSQLWPVGCCFHTAFSLFDPDSNPPHPCLAVAGGVTNDCTALQGMWVFTVDEHYWEEIALPPSFTARWYHTGGVTHGSASQATAVLFGGCSDNPQQLSCMTQTTAVDLALEPSKSIPGKSTGWTASVRDSTALALQTVRTLYNQALKRGYIESRSIVSILSGAAGSGKTHVKYLLLKKKPPVIRISTSLLESPVRAVSLARIDAEDDDWHELGDDEQCRIIAAAMSAGALPTEAAPESTSHDMGEAQQPQSRDDPILTAEDQSAEQKTSASHVIARSTSTIQSIVTPSTQHLSLPQLTTVSASTSQPDQESDDSGVGEELVRLMLTSSGSKKLLQADRIYLFDTGGQTIFHELLRLFLHRESITIFVTKLNERLDHHPMIEYYNKEGKPLSQPHPSPLTHEDILKHSFRAVQSQALTEGGSQEMAESQACTKARSQGTPKLVIVGTHRDKEWQCSESTKQKNEKLIALLTPAFQRMLLYYGEEMKKLIFPVNAKNPGRQDQDVARELRKAILSAASTVKSHKTPLAWHLLEIALRKLAASMSRSILSRQECLRVARKLHLSVEEFDAALDHLSQLNLILYYRRLLPDAIFTDAQVVVDKVTELVQYSYILQCKPDKRALTRGELLEFRDEGILTENLMNEFPKHYECSLFTASDMLNILEHRLMIALIREGKFFMPSLLLDLPAEAIQKHRTKLVSPVAPLVIHFPDGLAPCGLFCSLIASLLSPLSPLHWELLPSPTNRVKPECVVRNLIKFKLPHGLPGAVALIDSYTHFEVHIAAPEGVCSELSPKIHSEIFQHLAAAADAYHYLDFTPESAILCESAKSHAEKKFASLPWWKKAFSKQTVPPPHAATISTGGSGNWWTCSLDPTVHGELEEKHMIWFRDATCNLAEKPLPQQCNTTPSESSDSAEVNIPNAAENLTPQPSGTTPDTPNAAERPTLRQLQCLQGEGEKTVRVMETVAARWENLAVALGFDWCVIEAIQRDTPFQTTSACRQILQRWLEEKGLHPVNWHTLTEALIEAGYPKLAADVRELLRSN